MIGCSNKQIKYKSNKHFLIGMQPHVLCSKDDYSRRKQYSYRYIIKQKNKASKKNIPNESGENLPIPNKARFIKPKIKTCAYMNECVYVSSLRNITL